MSVVSEIVDTKDAIKLLKRWKKQINNRKIAHHSEASRLNKLYYMTGFPSIILSSISGVGGLSSYDSNEVWISVTTSAIALCAGIFAALQTFMGFEKRSSSHRVAADSYGKLYRHIEEVSLSGEYSHETMKDVKKRYDEIVETSPNLPEKYNDQIGFKIKEIETDETDDDIDIINKCRHNNGDEDELISPSEEYADDDDQYTYHSHRSHRSYRSRSNTLRTPHNHHNPHIPHDHSSDDDKHDSNIVEESSLLSTSSDSEPYTKRSEISNATTPKIQELRRVLHKNGVAHVNSPIEVHSIPRKCKSNQTSKRASPKLARRYRNNHGTHRIPRRSRVSRDSKDTLHNLDRF
jgi:hypothetical protein